MIGRTYVFFVCLAFGMQAMHASVLVQAQEDSIDRGALAMPTRISSDGAFIDVPGMASPFYGDFDGDGLNDLLVGQMDYGLLRIYRNVGSNRDPRFDGFEWFEAGGQVASVPTGCAVGFTPQMIDYDGDGLSDILTGSFTGGLVFVFRRHQDGSFAEVEVLETEDQTVQLMPDPHRIQYNSTAFAHDWNGDGDLDLIIGRSRYQLVENRGSNDQPRLATAVRLQCQGEEIRNGRTAPIMADWDGNGRDDLIASLDGAIVYYPAIGMREMPEFGEPIVIVGEGRFGEHRDAGEDGARDRPSNYVYSLCVADFNDDGIRDLLVGDTYTLRRELTEAQQLAVQESNARHREFWSEYRELILSDLSVLTREERIEKFRSAVQDWRELTGLPYVGPQLASPTIERHGGVWLFEGKSELE